MSLFIAKFSEEMVGGGETSNNFHGNIVTIFQRHVSSFAFVIVSKKIRESQQTVRYTCIRVVPPTGTIRTMIPK